MLAAPAAARAEDRVAGAVAVYHDSDHVTVVSPTLAGTRQQGRASADARLDLDVISAASIDLVTAASPAGFQETRTAVDGTFGYDLREGRSAHAGYGYSYEPDFRTHSVTAGGAAEAFGRRTTLSLDYGFARSRVGRVDDSAFERTRATHRIDLGVSHVLSPVLVAEVAWGVALSTGYHANPYRFVRLYQPGMDPPTTAVTETAPAERLRHLLTARLRARPIRRLFAIADYRLHLDDWGVVTHTATGRATFALAERVLDVSVEIRGYTQGAADFYRSRYDTFPAEPVLRTANKELGPMRTLLGGVVLDHVLYARGTRDVRVGLGGDWLRLFYLDYPALPVRTAVVLVLDLEANL